MTVSKQRVVTSDEALLLNSRMNSLGAAAHKKAGAKCSGRERQNRMRVRQRFRFLMKRTAIPKERTAKPKRMPEGPASGTG